MLLQRSSGRVSEDYQDHKVGMLCSLRCKSVLLFALVKIDFKC